MNGIADLRVNAMRLWNAHMELAQIGALPGGGCCRLGLTPEDRVARDRFTTWCRQAGCRVTVDQAGNIFAVRAGRRAGPPVTSGSHLDTQPHGGRFDGIFGVLAGLEVIRSLNDAGVETDLPVAVVNWTNEEGVRYPGLCGSQAFAGRWTVPELRDLPSVDGKTFGADLALIGYDGDQPVGSFPMSAFFEIHIEQGPILEQHAEIVGVVTRVQGLRWIEVTVTGADRHAGTTPMPARRDALVAAAKAIAALDRLARQNAPDARVTVGRLRVEPNSPSTIPGLARFVVDLRHPESATLDRLEGEIAALCRKAADEHSAEVEQRRIMTVAPIDFDAGCIENIAQSASALGLPHRRMASGAIHDASVIGGIVPTAMIFVPSRDGISHDEAEWTEPAHLEAGCNVLLHAMLARAGVAAIGNNRTTAAGSAA